MCFYTASYKADTCVTKYYDDNSRTLSVIATVYHIAFVIDLLKSHYRWYFTS